MYEALRQAGMLASLKEQLDGATAKIARMAGELAIAQAKLAEAERKSNAQQAQVAAILSPSPAQPPERAAPP